MNNKCPICGNLKKHVVANPGQPSKWSKTCGDKTCIKTLTQSTNIQSYGHISNLHQKTSNGKTTLQNAIMKKYGVENISQLDDVKAKKQNTCFENYGVAWPMQSSVVRSKAIDTLLTKYGYDNISKVPEIIEKIKDTQIDRYGALFMQTEEGKELMKSICREKYGVDWYFSSSEFKSRLEQRCMELYGVPNPFMSSAVQAEIAKRNGKGKSKGETEWLDSLNILPENRQYPIKSVTGKTYIVDGYDPLSNTIYEYNGSFWHGNPDYHEANELHPIIRDVTFGELYNKTIIKQEDILNTGFNLIVKWS